jgi:hypothetical protein
VQPQAQHVLKLVQLKKQHDEVFYTCCTVVNTSVTILPRPSSRQMKADKIAALKRRAREFGNQQKTSDDAGPSYLENADAYKYDTLAIGRMIVQ